MENLTRLEKEVMKMLLAGNVEVFLLLKTHMMNIDFVKRELTGVGFYTNFILKREKIKPTSSLPGIRGQFFISDLIGSINEDKILVGFVTFIKDGYLSSVEGFTFMDDLWPEEINQFTLSYTSQNGRDFDEISKHWLESYKQ